jgi:hypothetical protein
MPTASRRRSPALRRPRHHAGSRFSSATVRTKCWRTPSWRCSSTNADPLSGHHLQLLPGVLRPVWRRLQPGGAGRAASNIRLTTTPPPERRHHLPQPECADRPPAAAAAIERLLGNPESVVVVDEAYIDFGGDTASAIALVNRHTEPAGGAHAVEIAFAGRAARRLRGRPPELIEALERVKNSFNSYPLDRLAIAGAVAAMADEAHFETTTAGGDRTAARRCAGAAHRSASTPCPRPPTSSSPATRSVTPATTGRRAARARHHRSPLQAAAHRPAPAHHHRHRCLQPSTRYSAERACAGRPSPCASVAAMRPRIREPAGETRIRLVRFWKS